MEYRSVMPEVVRTNRQFDLGDIGDKPSHLIRRHTQSLSAHVDRRLRYIENGEVVVAAEKEVVDQRRFAAANVYDGG